ncbi:MAG TPA: endolytic transglycosylase MltG [Vicinamibacterales bacterium]|nr:endolytic transglycosylase MltG [Vicinamibacterales bacterium]
MKKLAALFLLIALGAVGAVGVFLARSRKPYRGYTGAEQFVDIPAGSGTSAIGARLMAAGVVRDMWTYKAALWISGRARGLKAGEYRFDQALTPAQVIDKIARGDVYYVSLTIPEGLTIADVAAIVEAHGFGPAASFVEAAKDVSLVRALDPTATDLEGYLFPETYMLSRHVSASTIVRLMVDRFDHVFGADLREAAAARGLSVRQVVTLASIVEKETARPDERPLIAAVYTTRLRIGMPLQCDPTVIFALQRAHRYDGHIHKADLSFDSPYNTYRYPGLPPGPIAAPGKGSLDAAVHPADADFLYFVSRNDGTHAFARTLEEHNRNVQKYQVQYFRDQRAGRAGEASGAGEGGRAGTGGAAGAEARTRHAGRSNR